MSKEISAGNLYEMNKAIMQSNKIKDLTKEELNKKKRNIKNFMEEKQGIYYMLLCHEQRDYTIFNLKEKKIDEAVDILIDECLPNRGIVRSIEPTKDGVAIEIWLKIDDEAFCYFFFKYDEAVIEC